jgi:hypothetical protein
VDPDQPAVNPIVYLVIGGGVLVIGGIFFLALIVFVASRK